MHFDPQDSRYARHYFDHDSPYGWAFCSWATSGPDTLDTVPASELQELLSVAAGHADTPYWQGDAALMTFARDLTAALDERWQAADFDAEYVEHRDGIAAGGADMRIIEQDELGRCAACGGDPDMCPHGPAGDDEPVCCIDCGEPIESELPARCALCEYHVADLATIPSTPVPYGSYPPPSPVSDTHDYSELLPGS